MCNYYSTSFSNVKKGFYDIKPPLKQEKKQKLQDILDLDCRQPIFKPQGFMKIKVGGKN